MPCQQRRKQISLLGGGMEWQRRREDDEVFLARRDPLDAEFATAVHTRMASSYAASNSCFAFANASRKAPPSFFGERLDFSKAAFSAWMARYESRLPVSRVALRG